MYKTQWSTQLRQFVGWTMYKYHGEMNDKTQNIVKNDCLIYLSKRTHSVIS